VNQPPTDDLPSLCPLCGDGSPMPFVDDKHRPYWRCPRCALVFVPAAFHVSAAAERACYDQHQNDPDDPRYVQFLLRLADPLLGRVPAGAEGLDFGSGPAPVLAALLTSRGRPTSCYDPHYAPDASVWTRTWDFITACEVVEHLANPRAEFDRLFRVLRPGGWLGVMTKAPPDADAFLAWRYRREATHVAFYSRRTLLVIAEMWGAGAEFPAEDVVMFRGGRSPRAGV
jgi:SAM-dependent methyltransferase